MQVWKTDGRPVKAWVDGVPLDPKTIDQAKRIASMPFIHRHVALMPDAHLGKGATVGSVIATKGAIVPAAVGVDLGCGMEAVETTLTSHDLPENLRAVRERIEEAIPHGRTHRGQENDEGAWGDAPNPVRKVWRDKLSERYDRIVKRHPDCHHKRAIQQLGTLGTGNHFVELCLDERDRVWIMLHSGSRGPGNRVASEFIARAKKECQRWCVPLPESDLAYLPEGTPHFEDYMEVVGWAQDYAALNRALMMEAAVGAVRAALGAPFRVEGAGVSCHHNYVARENHYRENVWVTRKGAVRARAGDLGIIPGSMGQRSFIVRGKGNPESFHSCSHGAGRVMSRTEARKRITVEDHAQWTEGVECRKDEAVLDEARGAYKDVDAVMAAQADLVEVVHTLSAMVCVKG